MVKTNCYKCEHKENVPGNYHMESPGYFNIKCAKPDPEIAKYLRENNDGWFVYPLYFDPLLITKDCKNYFPKGDSEIVNTANVLMKVPFLETIHNVFNTSKGWIVHLVNGIL